MIVLIQVRDEGITDDDLRADDVYAIYPDDYVPGARELQRWLVVKMPEYPGNADDFVTSEYAPGPGNEPVVRRKRKYRVDWKAKLTAEEIASVLDINATVPIVVGKFTPNDFVRK